MEGVFKFKNVNSGYYSEHAMRWLQSSSPLKISTVK